MSTSFQKAALRLAIAIHDQLADRNHTLVDCELPETSWQRCQTLSRRIQLGHQRGWTLAAERCQRDLRTMVDILRGELSAVTDRLDDNHRDRAPMASVEDIYRDLLALHDEFDAVAWDRRQQTLSVTTEPIELESIYLGEFEIRLDWGNLLDGHPENYRVIAVDSHPAASNDSVTHPHVQDEAVCEGDGRVPIRCALEQGRLFDFFVIVNNVLQTYNAGSPFVALEDWHGVTCNDCGSSTSEDERWTCIRCESTICDGCQYGCSDCGDAYCSECIDRCEGCDDHYCQSCLKRCDKCRVLRCNGCLDEQERCSDCHEEQAKKPAGEQTDVGGAHSDAAIGAEVQSHSVGETIVST